jgi:hypothetical protein
VVLEKERAPRSFLKMIGPIIFSVVCKVGGRGRPVFLKVGVPDHDEWSGRAFFRNFPQPGY